MTDRYRIETYEHECDGRTTDTYTVIRTDRYGEEYDLNAGEPITDLSDLSDYVHALREQGAYGHDVTAELLEQVADLARQTDSEDVCHACGGRVEDVDTEAEAREHPAAGSYCRRCGRWCAEDGAWHEPLDDGEPVVVATYAQHCAQAGEMTRAELAAKADAYDRTHTEGGQGYNPYRQQIREMEQAAAPKPSRREDIIATLERIDTTAARECGTYDAERVEALRAELAEIEAADQAAIDAAWDLETTKARRVAWNARVRVAQQAGHQVSLREMVQWQADFGWELADLRAAVERHGL